MDGAGRRRARGAGAGSPGAERLRRDRGRPPGRDNDSDGKADLGDVGCENAADNDEIGTSAFSISDAQADEGDGEISFTVTRSGDTGQQSTNVEFEAGSEQETVTVTLNDDAIIEPDENFFVELGDPSNATVSDGEGTGTITDDDLPPNAAPEARNITATTDEDVPENITLDASDADGDALTYAVVEGPGRGTLGGTAPNLTYTPDADYNGPDSFTYRANDGKAEPATVSITVGPVNDAPDFAKGANQTVNEDAAEQSIPNWATNISAGPSDESGQQVSFAVTNDNNPLFTPTGQPRISPVGTLTYTPAKDASGSATVSVKATDSGGTADGGVDASDARTFTITVDAVNDAPGITVAPASGLETTEGGGTDTFTVVLDNQPTSAVTIPLSGSDDTEGSVTPAELVFTPANYDEPQTVTVTGEDDSVADGNVDYEAITEAAASDDGNYDGLNGADVSVTNVDDDGPPAASISDARVTEGDTGTKAATFIVTLDRESSQEVSVTYTTANGSARAGSDYRVESGTLTFAPGETRGRVTVRVNGDKADERTETFSVNLSDPTGATIADRRGAGTIRDNDPPPARCSDGRDNDNDGRTDGRDPGCSGPNDDTEGDKKRDDRPDRGPRCTIQGTQGPNTLVGTPGRDVICGLGGADSIDGLDGNDVIVGGPGKDTLEGDDGADTIDSRDGAGGDVADGGPGNDRFIRDRGDTVSQ